MSGLLEFLFTVVVGGLLIGLFLSALLAGAFVAMWVAELRDARRQRREARRHPGVLPDEAFRRIVEANWPDEKAPTLMVQPGARPKE